MIKFLILLVISVITIAQEQPIKLEFLQKFQVTINEPNKLKYFYIDIGKLTPEEGLVIQPTNDIDNGVHFYTQKDRKPTSNDYDLRSFFKDQTFLFRNDTKVKRLYFGFYKRTNGTASKSAFIFKVNTKTPILKSGSRLKLEIKKGYIGSFIIDRFLPKDLSLLIETNNPEPSDLYLMDTGLLYPNEFKNNKTLRMRSGVNQFQIHISRIRFGLYAKEDITINLLYSKINLP